jgi:glycine C-acetyltransferase/8-amino-7-oxononanoate synthase
MQDVFAEQLKALRAASLDRYLREISSSQGPEITVVGRDRRARRLINFSSNDYLGLANDSQLRNAAIDAINDFGVGAGASRLISGTQSPHLQLERALAKWKGTDAALCFSSGYAAALGVIPALVTKNDVVLLDKLCHASLIDGAKLSGAILRVFPHNNLRKLESHLQWAACERAGKRVLIVTESVFSMDGDRAPLRELVQLEKRYDALLMLDEAHAVGVIGPHGRGLAASENLSDDVNIQMGTLSKALGATGGYICGSYNLIEWLINRARSFIYSTAPPPATVVAALAAVNFLLSSEGEKRRLLLWKRIGLTRELLLSLDAQGPVRRSLSTRRSLARRLVGEGGSTFNEDSGSAIFPWMVGDEQAALDLAAALMNEGFLVPAIRYPTVAKGAARLRITVTASHQEDQIKALCQAIKRLSKIA